MFNNIGSRTIVSLSSFFLSRSPMVSRSKKCYQNFVKNFQLNPFTWFKVLASPKTLHDPIQPYKTLKEHWVKTEQSSSKSINESVSPWNIDDATLVQRLCLIGKLVSEWHLSGWQLPYGWPPHVCPVPTGGPKAKDGQSRHVCLTSVGTLWINGPNLSSTGKLWGEGPHNRVWIVWAADWEWDIHQDIPILPPKSTLFFFHFL